MLRVVIEDYPQKNNAYGIWSSKGSVRDIKIRSLHSQESHLERSTYVALFTLLKTVRYNYISYEK